MLTNTVWKISATAELKLDEEVFESSQESTILAREQSRRSKMEGAYKKGLPIEQSNCITYDYIPPGRPIDHNHQSFPRGILAIGISSHAAPNGSLSHYQRTNRTSKTAKITRNGRTRGSGNSRSSDNSAERASDNGIDQSAASTKAPSG